MKQGMSERSPQRRWVVKQGRLTLTVTSTPDPERGIETRRIEFRQGGKTNRAVIEFDLATGESLPPQYTIAGSADLAAELQALIVRFTDEVTTTSTPTDVSTE